MKAIRDLINCNLTDAKKAARNRSFFSICRSGQDEYFMTERAALMVAAYLKNEITYSQYCQDKHSISYES